MEITPIESKSQPRELTTTSYAVLAILSLREHSTYELTKQMRLSMHYIWPRAESNVYAEAKRLVDAGLAASRKESTGRRPRTVYEITDTGRAELADWLTRPSGRQRYEAEAVVKVLFAEQGTPEDLRASIRAIGEDAAEGLEHWQRIADAYRRGDGEYPDRFALSSLVARLLGEQQAATLRWAEWAERVVSGWDTPAGPSARWGVETIREIGSAFPAD